MGTEIDDEVQSAQEPETGEATEDETSRGEDEGQQESDFDPYTYYLESWAGKGKSKKPIKKLPALIRRSFELVWSVGRWEFIVSAVLQSFGGAGAAVQLLAGKDVLAGIFGADRGSSRLSGIAFPLVLIIATNGITRVTSAIASARSSLLTELCSRRARDQVLDVAIAVDLEAFETAAFYDRLQRADADGQMRPYQLASGVLGLITGLVGVVGIGFALFLIKPILLAFLFVAYVPLWYARQRISKRDYEYLIKYVENSRKREYLRSVLVGRDEAKEVRAFGLANLLRLRYNRLYDDYLAEGRQRRRKNMWLSIASGLATSLLFAAVAAFLIYLWQSRSLDLGQAGIALAGMQMLGSRLEGVMQGLNSLYDNALYLEDFHTFLALKDESDARRPNAPAPGGFEDVVVEDVTFHYPGSNRPALKRVSLNIRRGEVIALVGENGSGKTTLAKLLANLYRPASGRILWDGANVAEADPDRLRDSIAVIFQDFVRYKLPARENIGAGRSQRFEDFDAIQASAREVGAHDFIAKLPGGYDTILSKEYKGGRDLSVGQWQRVALARAFFRDAPFIILDEPTASLDARAEYELFRSIRSMSRGKTVLLISHRFSSVRSADRIYVLDQGEVLDHGTHDELMSRGGLYAELFTLQASAYLEDPKAGDAGPART